MPRVLTQDCLHSYLFNASTQGMWECPLDYEPTALANGWSYAAGPPTGVQVGMSMFTKADADALYAPIGATAPAPNAVVLRNAPAVVVDVPATLTQTDLDGMQLTFTAPASGAVSVTASAWLDSNTGSNLWQLYRVSPNPGVIEVQRVRDGVCAGMQAATYRVAGLTPGTAYTVKWMHAQTVAYVLGLTGARVRIGAPNGWAALISVTPIAA